MKQLAARLVCLGLMTACRESPLDPVLPLPVETVVDSMPLSAAFERPPLFSPFDVGPPTDPAIELTGGALMVSGVFYVPSADDTFYERMTLSAVRERYYQGTEPYDSTGAIRIVIDGGEGGAFPQAAGAQYTGQIHGMLPGRYRLTVELQGVVYEPGVLLDSIIQIP